MISSSKIAKLANIPLKNDEEKLFSQQLTSILDLVSKLQKIETRNITPTFQVTGLINVLRDDEIDKNRILTQKQALSNAKKTHDGYFVN